MISWDKEPAHTWIKIKHFRKSDKPMTGLAVEMGGASVVEMCVVISVGRRVVTVMVVPVLLVLVLVVGGAAVVELLVGIPVGRRVVPVLLVVGDSVVLPLPGSVELVVIPVVWPVTGT